MSYTWQRTAAATAAALGILGLGSGLAQAAPGNPGPPVPPVPGIPGPAVPGVPDLPGIPNVPGVPNVNAWVPGMPPGQNPWGPPGQVMKMPTLNVNGVEVPNPFEGVPPGHWGDPAYLNLDDITWMPPVNLLPPGIPPLTEPLNLVWNAASDAWGVFVDENTFIPFPIQLPAPLPEM